MVIIIKQVDEHAKIVLTSQLFNGISRVVQKLIKYFNGTINLTFFVLPTLGVFPVISSLDLNESESTELSFGSSL